MSVTIPEQFHNAPAVWQASPAALGLWVLARSWSATQPDPLWIPDLAVSRLVPDGDPDDPYTVDSESLAQELVDVGLWVREKGGYIVDLTKAGA